MRIFSTLKDEDSRWETFINQGAIFDSFSAAYS